MTDEQIKNMRNVMFTMFGPVALMLPDAEVIAFRDEIQRRANELPDNFTEEDYLQEGDFLPNERLKD